MKKPDCQHEQAFTGTDQTQGRKCGAVCPECKVSVGGFDTFGQAAKAFYEKYGTAETKIAIG